MVMPLATTRTSRLPSAATARASSPGGGALQGSSVLILILAITVPPLMHKAAKIGPDPPMDWLARVTICPGVLFLESCPEAPDRLAF